MLSIVLVGSGNVAHHLYRALGNQIVQVFGRNPERVAQFSTMVDTTTKLDRVKVADLYLLAVSDDAIAEVSEQFSTRKAIVAHTSGSVPMEKIKAKRKGVFYPLQTFTEGKTIDFSKIPICLEAENEVDYEMLEQLGNSISNSVHKINSQQRKTLHLAAVFSNNFSNHLFQLANEICQKEGVDFSLLYPLIEETVNKIKYLEPKEAQTGPAKRNDIETMQRHLDQLEEPIHKKIYQLISESIRQTHEKKL